MGSFGTSGSSPYKDGDVLSELEFLRRRLRSLQDDVSGEQPKKYLEATRRSLDRAMKEIVDRNMEDGTRFSMMLERFGVPDELLEKIMDRAVQDE